MYIVFLMPAKLQYHTGFATKSHLHQIYNKDTPLINDIYKALKINASYFILQKRPIILIYYFQRGHQKDF